VRLQLIAEKVAQAPWHDRSAEPLASRAPATFCLKALETQLQDCKRTIQPELQQDGTSLSFAHPIPLQHAYTTNSETLLLYLHSTELTIYEIALSRTPLLLTTSPAFPRLDSLYACLHATKSWFDLFLSIPAGAYIGFSTAILMQMAHCVIMPYRLSTFDDAEWDHTLVRETLDFSSVLDALVQRMVQVRGAASLLDDGGEENNVWCLTERRLRGVRSWWLMRVAG